MLVAGPLFCGMNAPDLAGVRSVIPPWRVDTTCAAPWGGVPVAFEVLNKKGEVLVLCERSDAQCPWRYEDS